MKKETLEYLNAELNNFQKASELQFTHFMGVFYFWTLVVSAPVTAGLLTSTGEHRTLGILLLLTSFLGLFLSAKMFDIRCSQLRYISEINRIRGIFYDGIKNDIPKDYGISFPPNKDLRRTALSDFGIIMAITMSALEAVFFGFALPLVQGISEFNFWGSILFFILGLAIYISIIFWRGPKPFIES